MYLDRNATADFLITTRLDNDDCIHVDFVNEVQKQFNQQEFLAIDFSDGYTLQTGSQFYLGKKEHLFNPFMSLIERNHLPKTIWHYMHTMWKREPRIIHLAKQRLWLSIIHEKNKVNQFDGYGNVSWASINHFFITSEEMKLKIDSNQVSMKHWVFKSFSNYIHVKKVLYGKLLKKVVGIYKRK